MKQVVLIGSGNVGWHLGHVLQARGLDILQVYSRKKSKAKALAKSLKSPFCSDLSQVKMGADLYIIAVKDDAIAVVAEQIQKAVRNALVVHTSGSLSSKVLKPFAKRYGNFYPLQTFSLNRPVSFDGIPIFIQANLKKDRNALLTLGQGVSSNSKLLTDQQKPYLHLAAVIANNLGNHLFSIAEQVLNEQDLELSEIIPLILESANKIKSLKPKMAQTGPAKRGDSIVVQSQLDLIEDPQIASIYKLLSLSINPNLKLK